MTDKQHLVVIGNGMAGARFIEEVVARGGADLYDTARRARAAGDIETEIRAFEEGLALYRRCHAMLAEAEQRVTKLVAATEGLTEEPFESGT